MINEFKQLDDYERWKLQKKLGEESKRTRGNKKFSFTSYVLGVIAVSVLNWVGFLYFPPRISHVKIYEKNNQKIIRLYKNGRDGYFIEEPPQSNNFISLNSYQKRVDSELEVKVEELKSMTEERK
jgi:hypothetical protein